MEYHSFDTNQLLMCTDRTVEVLQVPSTYKNKALRVSKAAMVWPLIDIWVTEVQIYTYMDIFKETMQHKKGIESLPAYNNILFKHGLELTSSASPKSATLIMGLEKQIIFATITQHKHILLTKNLTTIVRET